VVETGHHHAADQAGFVIAWACPLPVPWWHQQLRPLAGEDIAASKCVVAPCRSLPISSRLPRHERCATRIGNADRLMARSLCHVSLNQPPLGLGAKPSPRSPIGKLRHRITAADRRVVSYQRVPSARIPRAEPRTWPHALMSQL
jgi:hypothetical protein